jgi:hypothetical protein
MIICSMTLNNSEIYGGTTTGIVAQIKSTIKVLSTTKRNTN